MDIMLIIGDMKGADQMKEFYLWDYYEDYGRIGDYDTEAEAREAAKEWNDETDGECQVVLFKFCEKTKKYEVVSA